MLLCHFVTCVRNFDGIVLLVTRLTDHTGTQRQSRSDSCACWWLVVEIYYVIILLTVKTYHVIFTPRQQLSRIIKSAWKYTVIWYSSLTKCELLHKCVVGQYIITLLPYSCDIQRRKKYHGNGVKTVSMSEANHIYKADENQDRLPGPKKRYQNTDYNQNSQSLLNLNTIPNME